MKRILIATMSFVLLNGCASTGVEQIRTKKELKYKKILVMPFTKGDDANGSLARESFVNELALFPDIEIVGRGQLDETTIKNLGVAHPSSFGTLDFSSSPEGDGRRQKILESFKADAIIFGYCYIEQGMASLKVQMMEASGGSVILSFSKDSSIHEGLVTDEAAKDIAQKAAQKTIDFLKENVVVTKFRRR